MYGLRIVIALLLVFICLPANAAKRIALVIGNSAYRHAPALVNPANDANDMAAKLESLGFEVVLGEDLDLAGMRRTVRSFVDRLDRTDIALFYYSGHGLQVNGENYMVPVDAQLSGYNDLDFEALPMALVLSAMERNSNINLIFLDACRDNPLLDNLVRSMRTRSGAVVRGLAKLGSGVGTLISFATQPGAVAFDGRGRNSPFTSALLQHLGTPGWDITRELIYVRRDVLAATDGKQVPWDNSSLTGDVILKPLPTKQAHEESSPVSNQAVPSSAVELSFWDTIKNSNDKSFYEAYLQQYPNGVFAGLAHLKLASIDRHADEDVSVSKHIVQHEPSTDSGVTNFKQAQDKQSQPAPPTAKYQDDKAVDIAKLEEPNPKSQLRDQLEIKKPPPGSPFDGQWRITRRANAHTGCGWKEMISVVSIRNNHVSGSNFEGTISKDGGVKIKLTFLFQGKYGHNILTGRIRGSRGSGKFYHVEGQCAGSILMSRM